MNDLRSHLDPDVLVAYRAGELPPDEEARVQSHLVACRECAELLLDLDALHDPDFGADEEVSVDAVWQGVREEIRKAPAPVIPFRRPSPPRWLQALAAMLAVAVVGLSLWVVSLRRTVDDLSRPELNAPVLDLASGTARGEGSPPPVATVPSGARLFTVILSPAGQRIYKEYRVEIVDAAGRVVWGDRGLTPNAYGSFSLTLPRSALGTGDFRVRLFGRTGNGEERIEEYALRVEP